MRDAPAAVYYFGARLLQRLAGVVARRRQARCLAPGTLFDQVLKSATLLRLRIELDALQILFFGLCVVLKSCGVSLPGGSSASTQRVNLAPHKRTRQ